MPVALTCANAYSPLERPKLQMTIHTEKHWNMTQIIRERKAVLVLGLACQRWKNSVKIYAATNWVTTCNNTAVHLKATRGTSYAPEKCCWCMVQPFPKRNHPLSHIPRLPKELAKAGSRSARLAFSGECSETWPCFSWLA